MIPARQLEVSKIVVKVDNVDLPNRIAHARDKTNVVIQVSWRDTPGGLLHIPNQGERWVATRTGHGPWYLDTKLDSVAEHAFVKDSMAAGDTRLSADGTLHVQMDSAIMNGRGIGTTVKDNFYSESEWETATLSSDPASRESIHPMLNGLLVTPDLYSVSGRVITFSDTMAMGNLTVSYQVWQEAMDDDAAVIGRASITGVDLYP